MKKAIPDWKNPFDYPDESAPISVWKWEFLRRNPEYRSDFENLDRVELENRWGLSGLCHPDHVGTSIDMVMDIGSGKHEVIKDGALMTPFEVTINLLGAGEVWQPEKRHDDEWHPLNRSQVAIVFDATLPISRQIEAAREYLENKRKGLVEKEPRKQLHLYQNYLRVLDAISAGVSLSKIAEVFRLANDPPEYQGEKCVRNWIAAATKLASGGYKSI